MKTLRLGKTISYRDSKRLVVIDAQNDFCLPQKGCAYYDRASMEQHKDDLQPISEALKAIKRLLTQSAKHKINVVALQSSYLANQFSDEAPMNRLAIKSSFGWQLAVKLPSGSDIVEKFEHDGSDNLISAFPKISNFVLCGFTTDNCVMATAEGLLKKGLDVTIVSDCAATAAYKYKECHQSSLDRLEVSGAHIIKSDDFLLDLDKQSKLKS